MKMCPRPVARALVAAAGVLCAMSAAADSESGSLTIVASGTAHYTTLEHAGRTVTGGPLGGAAAVAESSGGLFSENDNFHFACIVYSRQSAEGIDLEAPCTYTDASGDSWYVMAIRHAGDVEAGGGGPGNMDIMGGTGKFAGIAGNCSYQVDYMPGDRFVTRNLCEWTRQ